MNFWLNLSKPAKIILATILLVAIAFGVYLLFWSKVAITTPQLKDFSRQPRPAPILPTGKQTYEVVQRDFTYQPKIRFITLDPVDPKEGQEQKITVQVDAYSKPVSVISYVQSAGKGAELKFVESKNPTQNLTQRYFVGDDNNLVSYSGQKISRENITNKFNARMGVIVSENISTSTYVGSGQAPTSTRVDTSGRNSANVASKTELKRYEYSATWKASKDFFEHPSLSILVNEEFADIVSKNNPKLKIDPSIGITKEIISFAGKNKIPLTIKEEVKTKLLASANLSWGSACELPLGGNSEVDSECVVTYPDGVDGGNLLIKQVGRILLDSDFAVNPGKSIILSADSQLIVNTSKAIKESYLWKKVSDFTGAEEIIADKSPGKEYLRRYAFEDGKEAEFRGINANGEIFKIKTGRNQFTVSGGDSNAPKIVQGDIDPLDVRPGDIQKMKIVIQSEKDVASVLAKIETDKGIVEIPLVFEGKTAQKDILPNQYLVNEKRELVILPVKRAADALAGSSFLNISEAKGSEMLTYSGSWEVKDTIAKRYRTTIIAKDVEGNENSITMAWSDPCGTNNSYNDTLYTANCTTGVTQGNSRGNLAVGRISAPAANPTITINTNGVLYVETGYTLSIVGTSKIVMNGGTIRIAYSSAIDQDGDNYAIGGIALTNTAPTGYYRTLNRVPAMYWTDCVDTDSDVHPGANGQTYPGSNGWDWNCSGMIESGSVIFTAGCSGDANGCSWYGSCAYGGYAGGMSPGYCGCGNDFVDGCTSGGGPGIGGCEPDFSCNGYYPNVIESGTACMICG